MRFAQADADGPMPLMESTSRHCEAAKPMRQSGAERTTALDRFGRWPRNDGIGFTRNGPKAPHDQVPPASPRVRFFRIVFVCSVPRHGCPRWENACDFPETLSSPPRKRKPRALGGCPVWSPAPAGMTKGETSREVGGFIRQGKPDSSRVGKRFLASIPLPQAGGGKYYPARTASPHSIQLANLGILGM